MSRIVPLIASLEEHLNRLAQAPEDYRPPQCPKCGFAHMWAHGHYHRKADRETGKLNPIPVPRFVCGRKGGCRATCSRVPSCLPPRRWYLWSVQLAVLWCLLSGASLRHCTEECGRSRSTVRRWWRWLEERHEIFSFKLLTREPEWGRAADWSQFWRRALAEQPLAELMAYLDGQGVIVP